MSHASVNAPDGWRREKKSFDFSLEATDPDSIGILQFTDLDASGTASLAEQVKFIAKTYTPPLKVMKPVEIDGVDFYHLAGRSSRYTYAEAFGTIYHGGQVALSMNFPTDLKPAERQEVVDSVLASFHWK